MDTYVHLLHLHWRHLVAEHKVMPNSLFCVMKHSWMYIVTIFVGQWSFPLKFEYELRQCDTDFPVFTNSRSPVLIVLVERCILRYAYHFFSLSVLKKPMCTVQTCLPTCLSQIRQKCHLHLYRQLGTASTLNRFHFPAPIREHCTWI